MVVYRLLTAGSVEIDMMEKQISKKKLERLTIHGGDYRVAGRRAGGQLTLNRLKNLLEDDVRNLSRMSVAASSSPRPTSATALAAAGAGAGAGAESREVKENADDDEDVVILEKEEVEAFSTMARRSSSRGRLSLGDSRSSSIKREGSIKSAQLAERCLDEADADPNDISDEELQLIMNRSLLFPPQGDESASSASSASSAYTTSASGSGGGGSVGGAVARCLVPLEGTMYDILQEGAFHGGMLQSLR